MGGPGDDGGNEVTVDPTGNILVTATSVGDFTVQSQTYRNGGRRDCYVMQLAPGGQLIWAAQLTGRGVARVRAVGADGHGNVYGGFQFTDRLKLDGVGYRSRGSWDGLVVKWSPSGRVLGVEQRAGHSSRREPPLLRDLLSRSPRDRGGSL